MASTLQARRVDPGPWRVRQRAARDIARVLELVYLDAVSKAPRHVRRVGEAWTPALVISATGLDSTALASRP